MNLKTEGAFGCYAVFTSAGQRDTDQRETPSTGRRNRVEGATNPNPSTHLGFPVPQPAGRTSRLARSLGATGGRGKSPRFTNAYSTPGAAMFSALSRPAHCRRTASRTPTSAQVVTA